MVMLMTGDARSKYNLNAISHDTAAGLIQKVLASGVNVQQVIL
jgi:ribonuclease H2 subunit A